MMNERCLLYKGLVSDKNISTTVGLNKMSDILLTTFRNVFIRNIYFI